jgi:hypothetical protein
MWISRQRKDGGVDKLDGMDKLEKMDEITENGMACGLDGCNSPTQGIHVA